MAKKSAYFGCMLGLAVICGYLEALMPFDFGIPGIKLGLANIIMIFLLYKNGLFSALAVNVARVVLVGILFGHVMSIMYSLAGGVLSLIVMWVLKRLSCFSIVGVSVAGAVAHNIGQLAAALIVIGFNAVMFYLPFLLLAGVLTGFLIGLGAGQFIKRISLKF